MTAVVAYLQTVSALKRPFKKKRWTEGTDPQLKKIVSEHSATGIEELPPPQLCGDKDFGRKVSLAPDSTNMQLLFGRWAEYMGAPGSVPGEAVQARLLNSASLGAAGPSAGRSDAAQEGVSTSAGSNLFHAALGGAGAGAGFAAALVMVLLASRRSHRRRCPERSADALS